MAYQRSKSPKRRYKSPKRKSLKSPKRRIPKDDEPTMMTIPLPIVQNNFVSTPNFSVSLLDYDVPEYTNPTNL